MRAIEIFDALVARYSRDFAVPTLPGPASPPALAELERRTGLTLPADLRALYQRHDGAPFVPLLPDGAWWCPVEEALELWSAFAPLADEFHEELPPSPVEAGTHLDSVYHRRRLPFGNREDFHLCLDFAPGPRGVSGQALLLYTECSFAVVGHDFTGFLERWLGCLDRASPDPGLACWLSPDRSGWAPLLALESPERR